MCAHVLSHARRRVGCQLFLVPAPQPLPVGLPPRSKGTSLLLPLPTLPLPHLPLPHPPLPHPPLPHPPLPHLLLPHPPPCQPPLSRPPLSRPPLLHPPRARLARLAANNLQIDMDRNNGTEQTHICGSTFFQGTQFGAHVAQRVFLRPAQSSNPALPTPPLIVRDVACKLVEE